ncbi:MAG: hypothetical protein IJA52_04705, partial [Clostridia bacterium]|nr:hypothetical protein [Clostridia bacterium]
MGKCKTFFEKKVLHSKKLQKRKNGYRKLSVAVLFKSFTRFFSKNRGFLGQRPESSLARDETPLPYCGGT